MKLLPNEHTLGQKNLLILLTLLALPFCTAAQELEPRALTNIPPGMSFAAVAYNFNTGNILIDPSIPIKDLDSKVHGLGLAYARSLSLFGKYTKVDVIIPTAYGDWKANVSGEERERRIDGFADLRLRISMNIIGGNVREHDHTTPFVGGFNIQIIAPTGQYDPDRLINLGANRWTVRTQIGAAKQFKKWIVELYAGVWTFTENPEFVGGQTSSYSPLAVVKTHLIRKLRTSDWVTIDLGYGVGAKLSIEGEERDVRTNSMRLGITYALNLKKGHLLKASLSTTAAFEEGSDYDSVGFSHTYRWMRKKTPPAEKS